MEQKLPTDQMDFYKRTDEILYFVWDPIGICDQSWCRDEYRHYLPQIFKLCLENVEPDPIAERLDKIVVEVIGLAPNKLHSLKVAKLLLEVKEEIKEKTNEM